MYLERFSTTNMIWGEERFLQNLLLDHVKINRKLHTVFEQLYCILPSNTQPHSYVIERCFNLLLIRKIEKDSLNWQLYYKDIFEGLFIGIHNIPLRTTGYWRYENINDTLLNTCFCSLLFPFFPRCALERLMIPGLVKGGSEPGLWLTTY